MDFRQNISRQVRLMRDIWQYRLDVRYEQIKFMLNREFACLVPSYYRHTPMGKRNARNFRAHNTQSIQLILDRILRYNEQQTVYNLYYSMAEYKGGLPLFSPNLTSRKKHADQWKTDHYKSMKGYDWLIDIDAGDHTEILQAKQTTIRICDFLDGYRVPYQLRFSGCGFHIIVPYDYFKVLKLSFDPYEEHNIYKVLSQLSKRLNEMFSEMVDWNITDSRRVAKLPYSISYYSKKEYVCLPLLTDEELHDFVLEKYELMKVINMKIRGRGTRTFNAGNTNPQLLLDALGVKL